MNTWVLYFPHSCIWSLYDRRSAPLYAQPGLSFGGDSLVPNATHAPVAAHQFSGSVDLSSDAVSWFLCDFFACGISFAIRYMCRLALLGAAVLGDMQAQDPFRLMVRPTLPIRASLLSWSLCVKR